MRALTATNALVLLMVAAFVLMPSISFPALGSLGFSTAALVQGHVWTLLTSIFTHVDAFHLAVNMLFLYIFGNALEGTVGAKRTVSLFFVGGIAGLILAMPFYPPYETIVGSSIAVSAVLGGVIVLNPSRSSSILFFFLPLGLVALIYLIFNGFMLLYDQSGGVAWPSHVIGFATGALVGLTWRKNGRNGRQQPARGSVGTPSVVEA